MQEMIYLLQPKIFVYLSHNVAYNHLWYVSIYSYVNTYIFISFNIILYNWKCTNKYNHESHHKNLLFFLYLIILLQFLLASTRDLHTVSWLDNFTQPITINNYWDEDDDYKPGSEDTFLPNDRGWVRAYIYSIMIYEKDIMYMYLICNDTLLLQHH